MDLFKRLLCYPNSYSWSDSEENVVNARVSKLEKIVSNLNLGLDFLQYKEIIEDKITEIKTMKKEIRIRERLNMNRIS